MLPLYLLINLSPVHLCPIKKTFFSSIKTENNQKDFSEIVNASIGLFRPTKDNYPAALQNSKTPIIKVYPPSHNAQSLIFPLTQRQLLPARLWPVRDATTGSKSERRGCQIE